MMEEERLEELINYRINRAKETLAEISILIDHHLWNTAVNRLYYACYYAVSALLIKNGIEANTHSGVRLMFGMHFIKTGIISKDLGRFFSEVYDKRQTGDYDDFLDFDKEDVLKLLDPAKSLIVEVEKLLK